ncbi:MAG: histidine--tRNA ligase [Bacteroidota bacterium]
MQKPSIPKGTRDFSPLETGRRNYIFDTIRSVFSRYGYAPIETPAMENLSTLLGKYGEEGDKLLFRILDSGDFWASVPEGGELSSQAIAPLIAEKGLRYDLTVPFARYVVQHRNEITFPFKRYQIQPVWRADRPQKGRYREFYQCDADVIGSDSLLNEFELVRIIEDVFRELGIRVLVKINNRKILAGIAEVIGEAGRIVDITIAIDKLEKIGEEAVLAELVEKGVSIPAIEKLKPVFGMKGGLEDKLNFLKSYFRNGNNSSETGLKGVGEVEELFAYMAMDPVSVEVELDLTLARGLNYYTGAIFEVKALDYQIGSICGGGRYDDLTGIFGMPGVSGVGISFGADRIYDVMLGSGLFSEAGDRSTQILFVHFGEEGLPRLLPLLSDLRAKGISCEIYPETAKMKKQFAWADARKIPFVGLAGEDEMSRGVVAVKNMLTGAQEEVNLDDLATYLTRHVS